MSQFSNLPGGPVSAPVKRGHNWFLPAPQRCCGRGRFDKRAPPRRHRSRMHAHTHWSILCWQHASTVSGRVLNRSDSDRIRRVEEADMESEQWLYSDTNPSRHYYNVPITATDRNRLWGLQAKKKKCEFSSCRHCREKTNILSTATFRNFAKQGRWELHCPCHLSSAGKSCWVHEASLAGSLGPTTRRISVTTQGNSRPRGPVFHFVPLRRVFEKTHYVTVIVDGKQRALFSSASVRGDRVTPWWFWNEKRASKELSAKGGEGRFTCMEGNKGSNAQFYS